MKKINLISVFILVSTFLSYAQTTYIKKYGNNIDSKIPSSLIRTSENGYMITGSTVDTINQRNILSIKLDSAKNIVWSKSFNFVNTEFATDVVQTDDGGFLIVCNFYVSSSDPYYIGLIKIDSSGDTIWTKSYRTLLSTTAKSIIQTNDNGFIIIGGTDVISFGTQNYDIYVLKIDSTGNPLWNKTIGSSLSFSLDGGINAVELNDGGIMILGQYHYDSGKVSYLLFRTDSDGNTLWAKNIATLNICLPSYMDKTNDGGFIILGKIRNLLQTNYDIHVVKIDSIANVEWSHIFSSGPQDEEPGTVHQTSDGGYIITGRSVHATRRLPFLIKTNMFGDTLWTRAYEDGTTYSGSPYEVLEEPDGGFLISSCFGFCQDFNLIKTDINGYTGCFDLSTQFTAVPTTSQVLTAIPLVASAVTVHSYSPTINTLSLQLSALCSVNINETILQKYSVYPNPFTSTVSIAIQKPHASKAIYVVRNIFGQELVKFESNNIGNTDVPIIDLNFLPVGMYLLEIIIDDDRSVEKIIKE